MWLRRKIPRRQKYRRLDAPKETEFGTRLLPDHLGPLVPADSGPNDIHDRRLPPSEKKKQLIVATRNMSKALGEDASRRDACVHDSIVKDGITPPVDLIAT